MDSDLTAFRLVKKVGIATTDETYDIGGLEVATLEVSPCNCAYSKFQFTIYCSLWVDGGLALGVLGCGELGGGQVETTQSPATRAKLRAHRL